MYLLTKVLTLKHFKTALREILCAQNGLWICGDQGVKVMIKHTLYSLLYYLSLSLSPASLLCYFACQSTIIVQSGKIAKMYVYSSSYFVNSFLTTFKDKDFEHIRLPHA